MAHSQALRLPCSCRLPSLPSRPLAIPHPPPVLLCPQARPSSTSQLQGTCQGLKPARAWADESGFRQQVASPEAQQGEHAARERWMPAHSINTTNTEQHLLSFLGATLLAIPTFGAQLLDSASSQPLFVAQALGVLAAIVAVHEAGHFAAARLQGIHVTKFAIGFGPSLVAFKRGEVEYSLRAIPLGGFVAFPDDDPNNTYPADDPNLLRNRSIPERAAVISAGVVANIIFAYTALLVQVATVGKAETAYLPGVNLPKIDDSSVAARAGFRSGDTIVSVQGYDVAAAPDQVPRVVSIIKDNPGRQIQFTVQRKDAPSPVVIDVVPEVSVSGTGRIGVSLSPNSYIRHVKGDSVAENVNIVNKEFYRLMSTVLGGLYAIITNFSGVAGQVSGPVAIVAAGADIARTDSAGLFQFCAIVNINLAVVNLLPLPALDGGYLLLLALEAVRGKKLPDKLEQGFMASGLLLLIAMGFSLVVKDTLSLLPWSGL